MKRYAEGDFCHYRIVVSILAFSLSQKVNSAKVKRELICILVWLHTDAVQVRNVEPTMFIEESSRAWNEKSLAVRNRHFHKKRVIHETICISKIALNNKLSQSSLRHI